MRILENTPQGSQAWHTVRAARFCASEAAAAMGISKYMTRAALLRQKATGITEEVTPQKRRLFDAGHQAEAAAREIAERLAERELFPVVGTAEIDGLPLLASFDGLDMLTEIVWENKLPNRSLIEQIENEDLEPHYWAQLEHQLLVSGATETLFTASDGTQGGTHQLWYKPVPERRAQVIASWKQFAADLADYKPETAAAPVPTGRAPETLPALHIEVTGMVTASNLDAFKSNALAVFSGINRTLTTDAEFADAEKTVKWCADVEDRLAAAKQHALSQTESIDALFRTIDDISAEARRVRLDLDKLVKARKEELRGEIVREGQMELQRHMTALNGRLGKPYMPTIAADFAGAIKGKRTVDSLRDAVSTTLASAKIDASATADKIDANLKTLRELAAGHSFLFADTAQIVLKAPDDLTMLVKSRIADHKAAEEKKEAETRERIRAEEQAKAEKAAREQVEREQRESEQAANERAAALLRAHAAHQEVFPPPVSVPLIRETDANVVPMRVTQPSAPATPPTLTLGMIGTRLGFNLSADFLKNLGFEATKVKASCLFHEADFPLICMRLVAHIQGVLTKQAA